jgi:hypothetical protein
MRGNSRLAENRLASPEVLCSMECEVQRLHERASMLRYTCIACLAFDMNTHSLPTLLQLSVGSTCLPHLLSLFWTAVTSLIHRLDL